MRKIFLIVFLVLALLGLAGGAALYGVAFRPNTPRFEGERSVKIPRGASFATAMDSLAASGLLVSRATFELMGKLTGWHNQIKAGHYTFGSGASNYKLLDDIRKGLQDPVRLTIPPGSRPEVVAAVAGREMDFSPEDFFTALYDTALARSLGTDPTHLFGFMLPETYFFYWLTDAPTVVAEIKKQFDRFYDREVAARADSLNLTKEDVVTLASIVEWETDTHDEKPRIAGVYLNRLRRGWPLQADPTVQYAVLEQEGQKRRLFNVDYGIRHPYNTYNFTGLPPGPLTNPSFPSIRSVVNAENHNYMYFVARGDGSHTFSRTLQEHNRAASQYHQLMRERQRQQPSAPGGER